jgi:hypothetical protein
VRQYDPPSFTLFLFAVNQWELLTDVVIMTFQQSSRGKFILDLIFQSQSMLFFHVFERGSTWLHVRRIPLAHGDNVPDDDECGVSDVRLCKPRVPGFAGLPPYDYLRRTHRERPTKS